MPDITINCGGETLHLRKGHYPNKAIAVYAVTEDGTRGIEITRNLHSKSQDAKEMCYFDVEHIPREILEQLRHEYVLIPSPITEEKDGYEFPLVALIANIPDI